MSMLSSRVYKKELKKDFLYYAGREVSLKFLQNEFRFGFLIAVLELRFVTFDVAKFSQKSGFHL